MIGVGVGGTATGVAVGGMAVAVGLGGTAVGELVGSTWATAVGVGSGVWAVQAARSKPKALKAMSKWYL